MNIQFSSLLCMRVHHRVLVYKTSPACVFWFSISRKWKVLLHITLLNNLVFSQIKRKKRYIIPFCYKVIFLHKLYQKKKDTNNLIRHHVYKHTKKLDIIINFIQNAKKITLIMASIATSRSGWAYQISGQSESVNFFSTSRIQVVMYSTGKFHVTTRPIFFCICAQFPHLMLFICLVVILWLAGIVDLVP